MTTLVEHGTGTSGAGPALRVLRLLSGLDVDEAAHRARVTTGYLHAVEAGQAAVAPGMIATLAGIMAEALRDTAEDRGVYTSRQAARLYGLHPYSILAAIEAGRLHADRQGGLFRIKREALRAWNGRERGRVADVKSREPVPNGHDVTLSGAQRPSDAIRQAAARRTREERVFEAQAASSDVRGVQVIE
ncbi:helix-turn-helix domain-containing protein [Rathayibacter soli]|uniref:helix-turn-helix domain-containing protein n=1 Tax=Rathayibacter soli TaxID=3144168 RepID=UPI0027E4A96A|nr:helix-turn-helix domain-containing protein [Glaciibacter superstes]